MRQLLIFSDLDGTLLDHHSYSWAPAQRALKRIAELKIPLMLSSSKTCEEILDIRRRLGNRHPFITENGSAVYQPNGYFDMTDATPDNGLERHRFALGRERILQVLDTLRGEQEFRYRGFHDMSVEELAAETGLSLEQAEKANQRDCSEPLRWLGTAGALSDFRHRLEEQGLRLLQGGRFLHVMGECDKGEAVRWIIERFQQARSELEFVSIALGDSPNDLGMLEVVDIPVLIPNESGTQMQLSRGKTAIHAESKGPAGWQAAMDRILSEY